MTVNIVDEELPLEIADRYIHTLSNCAPFEAIQEIIWNAVDAGATRVDVDVYRNDRQIVEIAITDNGVGIARSVARSEFRRLGTHHKIANTINSRGKKVHGRKGEGRFKAYALGRLIEWYTLDTLRSEYTTIRANFHSPQSFKISYNVRSDVSIQKGTRFSAKNYPNPSGRFPNDELLQKKIASVFAAKLISDKELTVYVNGEKVDPQLNIESDLHLQIDCSTFLRLLFWKNGNESAWLWCDDSFNVRIERVFKTDYDVGPFTVFVATSDVPSDENELQLGLSEEGSKIEQVKILAEEAVNRFFKERHDQKITSILQKIKSKDVYPYEGDAKTGYEKVERRVFDYCAAQIIDKIPSVAKASQDSQKLTFNLLKQALKASPPDLQKILSEVLKLSIEEVSKLASLLESTTLSKLIELGKLVTDRLDFLQGLEEIVAGDPSKYVKERAHLHKIIEANTWIFGEKYAITASDQSLNTVLAKEFYGEAGTPRQLTEEDILHPEGLNRIPDLILGRQLAWGDGEERDNLVVELKAPKVKIGESAVSQIKGYARTIVSNLRFDPNKTTWMFVAISSDLDDAVTADIEGSKDPVQGRVYDGKRYQVFVKTWSQVIQSAKARMNYLQKQLELESTAESGLKFLNQEFPEIMNDIRARADEKIS